MENKIELKKKEKKQQLNIFQTYILYFFLFSVLGWCIETIYSFITLGHFTNRGFLYGPLCPIYGYGALILIIFFGQNKINSFKLFISASIVFSIFEYFVSYILEVLFHSFWWDYRNDFYNLNGRIAIFYSLAWGFIAIIFVGHLYPFFKKQVEKITQKIPYKLYIIIMKTCLCAYIIDTIVSCINYLK